MKGAAGNKELHFVSLAKIGANGVKFRRSIFKQHENVDRIAYSPALTGFGGFRRSGE